VTNFKRSTKLYKLPMSYNRGLDRDKNGFRGDRSLPGAAGWLAQPRIVAGRYFSLGDNADAIADGYIRHYYGDEFFAAGGVDDRHVASARGAGSAAGR